jgi:hypothetical protein
MKDKSNTKCSLKGCPRKELIGLSRNISIHTTSETSYFLGIAKNWSIYFVSFYFSIYKVDY